MRRGPHMAKDPLVIAAEIILAFADNCFAKC
ncbi:Uncharacterised protein [Klebsiella pneumoniae]|uniref:Uncharacterized protein n=1 Tax=Klebsiella pneumoniae TaxID=573 RepID=A0A378BDU3_KLEPN|nr:Uncharacterised protein [Klebsiella pneumoniae]